MMNLLTVEEVAQKLRCSRETIRDLIRRKRIRASKVGRWLVEEEDLVRFVINRSNVKGKVSGDGKETTAI